MMIKILKYLFLIAIFSSSLESVYSQQPYLKKIEVASRISETHIVKIIQDPAGYLWLGTNQGVLKFNGTTHTHLPLPDSLSTAIVTAMFHDGTNLFVGFDNGCSLKANLTSSKIESIEKINVLPITAITTDADQNTWYGTDGLGVYIKRKDGTILHYSDKKGLSDNEIHAMTSVENRMMISTDLGLSVCTWEDNALEIKNFNTDHGLPDNMITCICPASSQSVFLGTENGGACEFNFVTNSVVLMQDVIAAKLASIRSIISVENEVWVISERNEVIICSWPDQNTVQSMLLHPEDISKGPKYIVDILYDIEGNIIFTTGGNDLITADGRLIYFTDHDGQPFTNIKALTSDKKGRLFIVNENGIYQHESKFSNDQTLKQVLKFPASSNEEIISLEFGPDSALWFGTFNKGLGRIDLKTKKVKYFRERDGLVNSNVLGIASVGPNLWLATLGGASKVTLGKKVTFENFGADSELGSSYIYCVARDNKDRIWFGTDGNGPVYFDGTKFNFLRGQFPQLGKTTVSIVQDQTGNYWFYSPEGGLQVYNGTTILKTNISTDSDKPEVFSMNNDVNGKVILFTSAGIALIDATSLSAHYIHRDDNFTSNYLNVIVKDNHEQQWIGAQQGLVRFRELISTKPSTPNTKIEGLLVMLQETDTTNHTFGYDQNHFTFKVTGLWFQQPDIVRYQYQLEGFDEGWINTKDNIITFPQLRPGNYTFRVRSATGNTWNDVKTCSYSFTIKRPIWQRWWFVLIVLLLVLSAIWVGIQVRLRNLKRSSDLQKEQLQSQFETLRNQVNPHFLFNSFNTLISTIAKDQEEAIDYVQKLSDYFRIILEYREKDVISLKEELGLVEHYFFLQKKRFGENLQIKIEVEKSFLESPIPPMTLQILAENAVKHNIITTKRPLTLSIIANQNGIVVKNTLQEKLKKEPSTGVGLQNIRNRYDVLFNRQIEVSKEENEFLVRLPLIELS
jgi:ligand-binding sensor domain-containing protein